MSRFREVRILGVKVHAVTKSQALEAMADFVRSGEPHQVATVNPEFVMTARKNREFMQVLNAADLSIPDGIGLVWGSRLLGDPIPERVAGSDLVPELAELSARNGWSIFFLGAAPGVAEKAAGILSSRFPGLRVAGTYAGSPRPEDEAVIVPMVKSAHPDILFVAYGAPAQDLWIARNQPRLGVPLAMGVGGALDFVAGVKKRAPRWVQRIGMEWFYRLAQEPWRWRRQLALPRFVLLLLYEMAKGRGVE